jgi:formate-dependent nitrite reductase membrane component NrfD
VTDGTSTWSDSRSYHGQQVIKDPVWTWEVPVYFFVGGVAGTSAGLAYVSGLRGNHVQARRSWAIALAGIAISPALLISDLGRPERFLNMLRMFKITSPMSVGSWVLAGSGTTTGLAAVHAWTGWFPRLGTAAKPAAAALGLPLSTYTAALIANTSVPAWHEGRRMLPFVFASGAALGAGAAGVVATPVGHAGGARRLALGAAVMEGATMELMTHRLGGHGAVYRQGQAGRAANLSRVCIAGGTALLAARGRRSRAASIVAGALLGAGALATRWAVFKAGPASASDPRYTVGPQRERVASGERPGAARSHAKVQADDRRLGSPATTIHG